MSNKSESKILFPIKSKSAEVKLVELIGKATDEIVSEKTYPDVEVIDNRLILRRKRRLLKSAQDIRSLFCTAHGYKGSNQLAFVKDFRAAILTDNNVNKDEWIELVSMLWVEVEILERALINPDGSIDIEFITREVDQSAILVDLAMLLLSGVADAVKPILGWSVLNSLIKQDANLSRVNTPYVLKQSHSLASWLFNHGISTPVDNYRGYCHLLTALYYCENQYFCLCGSLYVSTEAEEIKAELKTLRANLNDEQIRDAESSVKVYLTPKSVF